MMISKASKPLMMAKESAFNEPPRPIDKPGKNIPRNPKEKRVRPR